MAHNIKNIIRVCVKDIDTNLSFFNNSPTIIANTMVIAKSATAMPNKWNLCIPSPGNPKKPLYGHGILLDVKYT